MPKVLALDHTSVHVWRFALDVHAFELSILEHSLSADERRRAELYVFPEHRWRFVAARGLLRRLLGRYLDEDPTRLCFQYGSQGKPALDVPVGNDTVQFNLSHSHGIALVAVTRGRRIGIDVEWIRNDIACETMAQRFFARREASQICKLTESFRRRGFFACWTRKEAFAKATGEGAARPLDSFEVTLAPHAPAAVVSIDGDVQAASNWRLADLCGDPAYAATLAVEGQAWGLSHYQWPCSVWGG